MRNWLAVVATAALVVAPVAHGLSAAQRGGRPGDAGQRGQGTLGGVTPPRQSGPPKPAPRSAEGRVLLGGGNPAEKGVWLPGGGVAANPLGIATFPFQPWARALYAFRQTHEFEPHTRCKASGVVRQFLTPYGVEFVELPELQRVYIFDIGGPHTFRTIYMDGRSHPAKPSPTYYGHSIGWWEGDTLVVDSIGFNESFWIDREGLPHTEQLHAIERLTRADFGTMRYELTVDDPGAYTAPWTGRMNLRWEQGTELFEYVCQQANYAPQLMVGPFGSVERRSPVVP